MLRADMPDIDPIPLLMALGAFFPAVLLISALGRAVDAGDLDSSAALTLSAGWLVSLPIAAVVVSGNVVRREDVFGELVPILPGWYSVAADVGLALLIGIAGILILQRLLTDGRDVPLHAAGLFAITLWFVAHIAAGLNGDFLLTLSGIALLVCLVAATMLPRGRGACLGIGVFGVTLAIASCALALFEFSQASVECRHECVLGSALTGVLPNENLLGTAMVTTMPFAYLGFKGPARLWLTAYLAAVAIASGSRGALITAVVLLAVLLIMRPSLEPQRRQTGPAALPAVVLAGALIASVYVVLHDWGSSPISLTDRPLLWSVATDYIAEAPVFGHGPYAWEALYTDRAEIPAAAQHSTHNQWIDVLYTAGWVGVGLMIAVMVAALWTAGRTRPAVMTTLAALMLIGVGERAWSIGVIDSVSFSLIGLILLGSARPVERPSREGPGSTAAVRRPVAVPMK